LKHYLNNSNFIVAFVIKSSSSLFESQGRRVNVEQLRDFRGGEKFQRFDRWASVSSPVMTNATGRFSDLD